MAEMLQAVKGMNDILPEQTPWWQHFEQITQHWLAQYGYQNIRMPILEPTALFKRAIGEVTDIVEKEMYSFLDSLNGDALTLRPEGTASCVRAAIQHGLLQTPQRLYYMGAMYRHERPQKGRYRQFHQLGIEAFGYTGADVDVELLLMANDLWQRLGLENITLEINTLGSAEERAAYRSVLIAYLEQYIDLLDEEAKRRLYSNPLRILDSKNPALKEIIAQAPSLFAYLGEASVAHFNQVKHLLDLSNIAYTVNPRLVRGLDYYNHTVFEWVTTELGAQATVCAGGRYDGLIRQLGGKATPACGFGIGIERILLLLQAQGKVQPAPARLDAYCVHVGHAAFEYTYLLAQRLRAHGFAVQVHSGEASMKSQLKKADQSGARFALIVGDDELATQHILCRALRTAEQGLLGQQILCDETGLLIHLQTVVN